MESLLNLVDPQWWLTMLGAFATVGVLAIIFAETGLLFGFFLPGDSLLVAAGIFSSAAAAQGIGIEPLSLPVLLIGTPICAVAGAQLGHLIGAKAGRKLFDRPDSRLFKRQHVEKAEHFFEKFGPAKAVVIARFVPIVRTFLNPVAGVLREPAGPFFVWNLIGGILWTDGILLAGYYLADQIIKVIPPDKIDLYILPAVVVIVLISLIPIFIEVYRTRRESRRKAAAAAGPASRD